MNLLDWLMSVGMVLIIIGLGLVIVLLAVIVQRAVGA